MRLNWDSAHESRDDLLRDRGASAPFMCFAGKFWLRLSGGVYNTREDYEAVRDIIVEYLDANK